MIAYVIYNRSTPAERMAAEFVERLKKEQVEAELLDADSARGIQLVEHYDILGRPAVALIRGDGSPVQLWQGEDGWPTVGDVAYLSHG
jgi:hypothetical protein